MKYSIIIPARNEEILLPRCIAAVKASLAAREHEIIVVLNRCTDGTQRVALELGCKIVKEDAKNLSMIRNAGAKIASGEVLVTVDADSTMHPDTFNQIDRKLGDPRWIGGATLIVPERWSLGILTTGILLLPYVIFYGIAGGVFFCRAESFHAIGGFNPALSSAEDIDFARRLKRYGESLGQRFAILYRTPIRTSCRKFDHFGDWYFVLRPYKMWSLLGGRNQAAANQVWYDFPRE